MDGDGSHDAVRRAEEQRHNWVNAHMGRTSKETAARLLSTPQPAPPADGATITLHAVKARCVAGGASNFWILGSPAAEPTLEGDYPLIGISPSAYFVQAPEFNNLPYAVQRAGLDQANHRIKGDTAKLEAEMRDVYD